eukprot:35079-Eustigmatos_ZCMA.PRE.1
MDTDPNSVTALFVRELQAQGLMHGQYGTYAIVTLGTAALTDRPVSPLALSALTTEKAIIDQLQLLGMQEADVKRARANAYSLVP